MRFTISFYLSIAIACMTFSEAQAQESAEAATIRDQALAEALEAHPLVPIDMSKLTGLCASPPIRDDLGGLRPNTVLRYHYHRNVFEAAGILATYEDFAARTVAKGGTISRLIPRPPLLLRQRIKAMWKEFIYSGQFWCLVSNSYDDGGDPLKIAARTGNYMLISEAVEIWGIDPNWIKADEPSLIDILIEKARYDLNARQPLELARKNGGLTRAELEARGAIATRKEMAESDYRKYKAMADRGDLEGIHHVGRFLTLGHGVASDPVAAERWYAKAGEAALAAENWDYALSVGRYYSEPYFRTSPNSTEPAFPDDYGKAIRYLRPAAEGGNREAMVRAATLYERGGPGLARDIAQAEFWFLKAIAIDPDNDSQKPAFRLGVMVANGLLPGGVERANKLFTSSGAIYSVEYRDSIIGWQCAYKLIAKKSCDNLGKTWGGGAKFEDAP
ncbi:tetratricopeptide repeat protein [Sphingobium fuliginis]|uniref:Sel1 repeat family protein n=1 Tax=Sphingobium fuliginis ATCC 27551 TaxID=1208342 RepID=A0A5B8CHJ7_SPHSA|nr:tetratricopeptide repeat protein [Sphingobium fuliginis]QDC36221.1 sel1 repeat family protein [Sphingobium fuliginis ATCC 27551]